MTDSLTRRRSRSSIGARTDFYQDWHGSASVAADTLEDLLRLLGNLLIKLVGKNIERAGTDAINRSAVIFCAERDQLLRLAHRQRLEQKAVDQSKDCGVRPNSQTQRQNCDRGEAGALA